MADDLVEEWKRFSLIEDEALGFVMEDDAMGNSKVLDSHCLLGKLITERYFNKAALKSTMLRLWREGRGILVQDHGDNLFVFQFKDEFERKRVVNGSPWLFDKYLLALNEFDGSCPTTQIQFACSIFWVQLHGVPLFYMTKQTGERIGKQLSSVEEVDVPENGVRWGSSLRVGLSIDVTKPIPRGRLVTFQSIGQMWISFKYERFPWLCFHCSILGHLEKGCVTKLRCGGKNIGETKQYGPWLRVTKFLNHWYGSGGSGEQRNQTTAMVKAHGREKKNSFLNFPLHHNPNFLGNLISTGVNIQVTDSSDNVSPKQPQHPYDKDIRLETNLQHVGKSKDPVPSSIQSSSKLGTTVVEDNNEKVDVVPDILKDVGTSILSGTSSGGKAYHKHVDNSISTNSPSKKFMLHGMSISSEVALDKAKTSKHDTCNEVASKNMAINGGKKNNFNGKMSWKRLAREKGKTTGVSSEGPTRGVISYKTGLLAPEKKRFKSTDESFNSEFSSSAEAVVQPYQDQ